MRLIRDIRLQTGLRQSDLAGLLDVRLDQIKLAESGKRNLPQHAQLKLASLSDFLNEPLLDEAKPILVPPSLLQFLNKEKLRLEINLENALKKREQMNRLKQIVEHWKSYSPDPISEGSKKRLEILALRFRDWQEDHSTINNEEEWRCRLAGIEAQINYLNQIGEL